MQADNNNASFSRKESDNKSLNKEEGKDLKASKPMKVYQRFPGKYKFFFGGTVRCGPDLGKICCSFTAFIIGGFFFTICVMPFFLFYCSVFIFVPLLILFLICGLNWIIALFLLGASDPGIVGVPRQHTEAELQKVSTNITESKNNENRFLPPQFETINYDGTPVEMKYCYTCMLYREPRCSHCAECNVCIERFDHHCPWVGKCVGKRTYKLFIYFIFSSFILFSMAWLAIMTEQLTSLVINFLKFVFLFPQDEYYLFGIFFLFKVSQLDVITRLVMLAAHIVIWIPGAVILICPLAVAWCFTGALVLLHLTLISRNKTTYENLSGKKSYSRGLIRNWIDFCCSPLFIASKTPFLSYEDSVKNRTLERHFKDYVTKIIEDTLIEQQEAIIDNINSNTLIGGGIFIPKDQLAKLQQEASFRANRSSSSYSNSNLLKTGSQHFKTFSQEVRELESFDIGEKVDSTDEINVELDQLDDHFGKVPNPFNFNSKKSFPTAELTASTNNNFDGSSNPQRNSNNSQNNNKNNSPHYKTFSQEVRDLGFGDDALDLILDQNSGQEKMEPNLD